MIQIWLDFDVLNSHATIFGQKNNRSRHTSGMVLFHLDSDCFLVGLESVGRGGSRFVNRRYVRAKNWHFKNDSYKAVKKLMKMIPLQCILGLNFGPFLSIFRTKKQKFSEILTLTVYFVLFNRKNHFEGI